jgi:hypothetical protein
MSDYSMMRWNPLDIPEKETVLSFYPDLDAYRTLKSKATGLESDKCLRFALFLTDPNCPLNRINDFRDMLHSAAELAGFKKTGSGFPAIVERMIEGSVPEVSDMVYTLFTIHANYRYEGWFTMKKNYHYISKTLQAPPDGVASKDMVTEMEKRAKLQKQMQALSGELAKEEVTLFNNKYVKDAVLRGAAIKMDMYAERMAKTGGAI